MITANIKGVKRNGNLTVESLGVSYGLVCFEDPKFSRQYTSHQIFVPCFLAVSPPLFLFKFSSTWLTYDHSPLHGSDDYTFFSFSGRVFCSYYIDQKNSRQVSRRCHISRYCHLFYLQCLFALRHSREVGTFYGYCWSMLSRSCT